MKALRFLTLWLIGLVWLNHYSLCQSGVTTLGIQYRPMMASQYFGSGSESFNGDSLTVKFNPRYGHNFGFIVRTGVTDLWSFETGITLVQRNYNLEISHENYTPPQDLNFRLIAYEIPMQAMIYMQLGKRLWMNASGGLALDIYPSNVESSTYARQDSVVFDYYQKTWRRGWLQVSLLANYGFELRTHQGGYFYIGASYHRPFSSIAQTHVEFKKDNVPSNLEFNLSGNYLTLDLRYFFHEDPERKKKRSKD